MNKLLNGFFSLTGKWDWQAQQLRETFRQLLYSNQNYRANIKNALIVKIVSRRSLTRIGVDNMLKNIKPF